eukprot:TRINITY_DN29788_c1_g2_i1.p1 TRINITY_DN29788_c1_g2~~TRINITY_DN29788_c1_g2_i1.p1  ORF type:complete len:285 (-),score=29.22 TRINITY_DN29788_c1_g2_i1:537-1391(-)
MTKWILTVLTFISLCVHVSSQGLICFNPEIAEDPVAVVNKDTERAAAITEQASQRFEDILGNLTIDEAAERGVSAIVEVSLDILQQGIEENEPGNEKPDDIISALFQGFLNFTNGPEVMAKILSNPNNFVLYINLIASRFNESCFDDIELAIVSLVISTIGDLLDTPILRDTVGDILVTLTVNNALENDLVDQYKQALSGLMSAIDDAENLAGVIPTFEGALSQLYSTVLLDFATQIGLQTDPQEVANFVSGFLNKMQESFELNDIDFLGFLSDLFNSILSQLN